MDRDLWSEVQAENKHLTAGRSSTKTRRSRANRRVVGGMRELAPGGELAVSMQRRGDAVILWLRGELDLATSALLEFELDGAQSSRPKRLIVDLTGLELIDSVGLAALVQARRRACDNGQQLSFTQGLNVVEHAFASTGDLGLGSRLPHPEAATNEHCYFALAMACADVDHQRPPGDRPRGTTDGFPDQTAAASDALSQVSLAPRPFATQSDGPR